MAGKHKTKHLGGIGCGYLLKLALGTSLLMILNSYVIGLLVQSNIKYIPEFFDDVRLYQACQIFIPIVLVLIQFWIYDRLKDRLTGSSTGKQSRTSA